MPIPQTIDPMPFLRLDFFSCRCPRVLCYDLMNNDNSPAKSQMLSTLHDMTRIYYIIFFVGGYVVFTSPSIGKWMGPPGPDGLQLWQREWPEVRVSDISKS